jgi:hypothetical protein
MATEKKLRWFATNKQASLTAKLGELKTQQRKYSTAAARID